MTITPFLSSQGVISYLITNPDRQAVLIDSSFDMAQKIVSTLKKHQFELKYILDTHTHADFFSARNLFKSIYPKAKIGMSKFSPTKQKDIALEDNQVLEVAKNFQIKVWQANGHTNESLIYLLETNSGDEKRQINIFTGDALLIGGSGRTDFQLGESKKLYETLERILTLDESSIIYPGHNYNGQTRTTLAVEKITNKRLKMVIENKKVEFITTMNAHTPPTPELFEEAINWNSL